MDLDEMIVLLNTLKKVGDGASETIEAKIAEHEQAIRKLKAIHKIVTGEQARKPPGAAGRTAVKRARNSESDKPTAALLAARGAMRPALIAKEVGCSEPTIYRVLRSPWFLKNETTGNWQITEQGRRELLAAA